MALTAQRCRGPTSLVEVVSGDDLLAEPEIPVFTTVDTNETVVYQAPGRRILLTTLQAEYGVKTQDMALAALDNWEAFTFHASSSYGI